MRAKPRHVDAALSMLAKAGNAPADLQCGAHAPYCYEARGEVPPPPPYSPLAHNCSGKHSGMLAHCAACGYGKHDYLAFDHPLQQRDPAVRWLRSPACPSAASCAGMDGCSAPNYAMPLSRLALAFARLAAADVDPDYGAAPRTLADAMIAYPAMVSGERGADRLLMTAGRGDWVTKVGAEGVQALGVRSRGWGIAIKVADGSAARPRSRGGGGAGSARAPGCGRPHGAGSPWRGRQVRNCAARAVGETVPMLVLDKIERPLAPVGERDIQ